MKTLLQNPDIISLIELSLREDIGSGDHTSLACVDENKSGEAFCLAKENCVIAGLDLAEFIFKKIDIELNFISHCKDGDELKNGEKIFSVSGNSISILTAERTVLNFLQRLSGIATQSREISNMLNEFNTKVLDTRKTIPGMRLLEKYAVKVGGSCNHRVGLFDMIMIKDNHIDFAGGIKEAIEKTHRYLKANNLSLKIEIETRNLNEVNEVIQVGGVDRIMLDNFSPTVIKQAVELINGKFETEASGGITKQNIREFAATGVDYISVGALTHSAKGIDLSLKVS